MTDPSRLTCQSLLFLLFPLSLSHYFLLYFLILLLPLLIFVFLVLFVSLLFLSPRLFLSQLSFSVYLQSPLPPQLAFFPLLSYLGSFENLLFSPSFVYLLLFFVQSYRSAYFLSVTVPFWFLLYFLSLSVVF